ncbi:hypothetical protein POX_g09131 [Penicillium oxalicum]|uniref:Uncharacterized protein n=1 Tax=Penicillium oxalicum (strain 114-2 / CGMCC 5302) TaxID=933388 RepID=S7ZD05_PENO1|nr:hypothetical protein POX_g09131 [Penicillium oxalicum]EPS26571.1 hypothetical protein PDE_01508 [Penicillium oxalicum 114-2]KAI2786739.1 hypothetical protein POX_g09131 [Penicillium oxalicum]
MRERETERKSLCAWGDWTCYSLFCCLRHPTITVVLSPSSCMRECMSFPVSNILEYILKEAMSHYIDVEVSLLSAPVFGGAQSQVYAQSNEERSIEFRRSPRPKDPKVSGNIELPSRITQRARYWS